MKTRWELVIIPGIAKWSVTGFLVTNLSVIGSLKTDPLVIGPLGTGLNDHELIHEVDETVDEPAAKNHEAAEQADWVAEFF